jgi:hypothetical protein
MGVLMALVEIKIPKLRILATVPITTPNHVGSHLLIPSADVDLIPAALMAWRADQPIPDALANKDGGPLHMFGGHGPWAAGEHREHMEVVIKGLRIVRAKVVQRRDGTWGSHAQVRGADVLALRRDFPVLAGKLIAWADGDGALSTDWRGKLYLAKHGDKPDLHVERPADIAPVPFP